MRRSLAALVASTTFVMALAGCTDDSDTPGSAEASGGGDDARGQGQVECAPELDAAFRAWGEAGFSGSVALSTGGEIDCLAAYGTADEAAGTPNTVDTVFGIGSVSKAFTAAAIFGLVDDGALALDDRAGDLVPGLSGPVADATVEQLLLHTSGLTGSHGSDHEPLERDAAVAAIGRLEQAIPPGTDFLYSNAGYTLLALIVEEVSGATYRDHMASQVLSLPGGEVAGGFWDGEPAAPGPRAVGYLETGPTDQMGAFPGPHWAVSGNGDLAMTVPDLAAWAHALFTGQVVSPAAAEAIASPRVDRGDGTWATPGWVALDDAVFGEPVVATAGGGGDVGHNAVVAWLPESERVLAMASNTPDVLAEELLQAVGPALVAGDPLPTPDAPAGEVDQAALAELEGAYELATGGSFEVTAGDDGLRIAASGTDAVDALFPLPGGFTAEDARAHEDAVLALLAGETQEGREEREALEGDLGPIDDVELAGTIVDDGELRTYVTLTSGTESLVVWYALDEQGGIAAVDAAGDPPTLVVVPSDGDGFRPDDPSGAGPDVTVTFPDGLMTVSSPSGSVEARLAG